MRPIPSPAANVESAVAFVGGAKIGSRVSGGAGDDAGRGRRGPFRPGQLIPSRARLEARPLARAVEEVLAGDA